MSLTLMNRAAITSLLGIVKRVNCLVALLSILARTRLREAAALHPHGRGRQCWTNRHPAHRGAAHDAHQHVRPASSVECSQLKVSNFSSLINVPGLCHLLFLRDGAEW